jgi:hypothetical protein
MMKQNNPEWLPCERAALIALMLYRGRYLTTLDIQELFDCGMDQAKRDFQRLSRVLPINWREYPNDRRYKQWFWSKDENETSRAFELSSTFPTRRVPIKVNENPEHYKNKPGWIGYD